MGQVALRFYSVEDVREFVQSKGRMRADGADAIVQELGADFGAAPSLMLDGGTWVLTAGDVTSEHDSREDAFDAVESLPWVRESVARKHAEADAYSRLAEWRWIDAASSEDLPSAIDGSQIKDNAIAEMARNLGRAKTAVPIDGGNVSEVHETLLNSAARAAGWVFAAIEVRGEDGRPHLWLRVRLQPFVDEQVERQELLFGSVLFIGEDTDRYGSGEPIGARLVSYALTNTPFVDGLEPHAPRKPRKQRTQATPAGPWLAITRSRRIEMPKDKQPPAATRGMAMDTLKQLATSLGVDLATMTDEERSALLDKVNALLTAAQVDDSMAPAAEPEMPAPASVGGGREEPEGEQPPAARVEGLEGPALESWAMDLLGALREIFGQPDVEPAGALDLLRASMDAFKAALGGAEPSDDAALDATPAAASQGMRAELIGLRATIEQQKEQLAELRKGARRAEILGHIDKRWRDAKLIDSDGKIRLSDDERADLVAMCESQGDDWKKPIEFALRHTNVPAGGTVTDATKAVVAPNAGAPETQRDALDLVYRELREADPQLDSQDARRRASTMAPRRFPELFKRTFVAVS